MLALFLLVFLSTDGFSYETGLIKPKDRHLGRSYVTLNGFFGENLPSSYDLREKGWVSPVRNQGSCGSCWSFGTIDSLESSMRMFSKRVDLSQQHLVNCYYSGCGGGYFSFEKVKSYGVTTSALEPYTARNGRCKQDYSEEYGLEVSMNLGSSRSSPSAEEIKAAIYHFGAVAVTVTAGSGMSNYKSGVANRCSSGRTNHIVTLIGWNSDGTWILKNSWGTGWGMQGFGNWPVGCDRVGEEAAVSIYKAVPVANRIQLASLPKYAKAGAKLSVPFNENASYAWYVNGDLYSLSHELNYKSKSGDKIKVLITMPDSITEAETLVTRI